MDNYEHFISKNIKAYYGKRVWAPLIYMLVLIAVWFLFDLSSVLYPNVMPSNADFETYFEKESPYVNVTFENLTFSGYICSSRDNTTGYYYYTTWGDDTVIVLLSPKTCEQGKPEIDEITVNGRLLEANASYTALLNRMAEDLDWTNEGINNQMPGVFFSEPAEHQKLTITLFLLYFLTFVFAFGNLILYLVHFFVPKSAPACQNLVVYGHPLRMFDEAEEELKTLPQLATEDMFITEHYFIMTSATANAIVPIDQIQWIYKHSTLHKFLWHTFSISYTMHITARKHLYVHCPKNTKSDIDGIMDYLAEANHSILVGFSEENRLKVQEESTKPFHIEKIVAFFRKKI